MNEQASALFDYVLHCGSGEDDWAFAAKRLTIALHTEQIDPDITERLADQSPGRINALLYAMAHEGVTLNAVPAFVRRYMTMASRPSDVLRARRNIIWNEPSAHPDHAA